jgi:cytochrome c peroxidase
VALGKRLFFDRRLSGDTTQACASCHRPEAAFSDHGHARSRGIDGLPGTRRTMPLFNLAWSGPYTWDGRRTRLRDQALAPVANTREMHASLSRVISRLQADHDYPALFARAFGDRQVTAARIGLAIEQYLFTLISADSKFDRASRGQAPFTDREKRGLLLFITEYDPARGRIGADCFHCHGGNLFSDYRYANNGLDATFRDRGRALVTHRDADLGKFKTPSLRNVAITGPYMHDGRFKTLEQVIDHYTSGVYRTATLDPNIAKHPDTGMVLSAADKRALVAFLKTLTDTRYTAN